MWPRARVDIIKKSTYCYSDVFDVISINKFFYESSLVTQILSNDKKNQIMKLYKNNAK